MRLSPFATLTLSTGFYSLLGGLENPDISPLQRRAKIKAISALHSITTTLVALYVLRYTQWDVTASSAESYLHSSPAKGGAKNGNLDDSNNPIIAGRSTIANGLTAWEAGYLTYDTCALICDSYARSNKKSLVSSVSRLSKESPIFLAHHVALISALLYLQTHIATGREKGLWVIVAFLLMNASNPLLHARWWARQKTGTYNNGLDVAFALVFAVSRFGLVAWVLRRYGAYHSLGAWNAYKRLRWQCKTGTVALVGFNVVWWILLVNKISKRLLLRLRPKERGG